MNNITLSALLLNAANIPYKFFSRLCRDYEPSQILEGENFWKELGLNKSQQTRLSELLSKNDWANRELDNLSSMGARFITANDRDYPVKLLDLTSPPVGLYVKGNLNLSLPSIAVVGTRKPSLYASNIASNIAKSLAQNGIITISGGAKGIDSSAHRGSLESNGPTIAVFGTSLDKFYPTENKDLFMRIIENGAIISEYPLNSHGETWHFPARNRIIAALSSKVIIVESREDGGAMITAEHALKLNRELWAVPGRINETSCKGTNKLIYEGANCLYDIAVFIEKLTGKQEQLNLFDDEHEKIENEKINVPEMSDDAKIIYSLIQKKNNILIDDLINESNLDFSSVNVALIELEADGLIRELGGRYSVSL